jgi:hypothetical protein
MDKVRKNLLAFVEHLKHAAAAAELSPEASDDDKAALREAPELLARSVANLIKIIDQHDALLMASAALPGGAAARLAARGPFVIGSDVDLSTILYGAAAIGDLALDNPVTRRALMQNLRATVARMKAERTAPALKENRHKVTRRDEVIRKHADRVRAEHPDWTRWHIAGEIEEPVRAVLKTSTRGTIDRRLRAMKFV